MTKRELTEMRIDDIKISNRYRKDLGDVESLAKSITEVGLLNPITVTYDNELLAGQRRIEAHRLLGLTEIPAIKVKDLTTAVKFLTAERDENDERKEMTVSEKVALAAALEEFERPRAEQRRREAASRAGKISQGTYKPDIPTSVSGETEVGRSSDIAGKAVGLPSSSYFKARTVVKSVDDPDLSPEVRATAAEALAEMDATGNISGAYEKVKGVRDARVGPPGKPVIHSAAKQRRAITAADHALSGMAYGFDLITTLHPDITSDEAAEWVDGLAKSRRSIERVINLLRERTNA